LKILDFQTFCVLGSDGDKRAGDFLLVFSIWLDDYLDERIVINVDVSIKWDYCNKTGGISVFSFQELFLAI